MYYEKEKSYIEQNTDSGFATEDAGGYDVYYRKKAERRRKRKQKKFTAFLIIGLCLITGLVVLVARHMTGRDVAVTERPVRSPVVLLDPEENRSPAHTVSPSTKSAIPVEEAFPSGRNNFNSGNSSSGNSTSGSSTSGNSASGSSASGSSASGSSYSDEPFRYHRSLLSGDDLEQYDSIRAAIGSFSSSVSFSFYDPDRLLDIAQMVYYDYPEYFWFTGSARTSYRKRGGAYSGQISFEFSCSSSEADSTADQIRSKTAGLVERLTGLSDYEKVKGVYEFIINNTVYSKADRDQTCVSVLTEGRGVCAGYASAMNYLLNELGVPCIHVTGYSKNEGHAWNIVKVEGDWYHADCTWGDPVSADQSQKLSYDYLLLNDTDIRKDHVPSDDVLYPACTATEYNYYIHEGYYLSCYSLENMREICARCTFAGVPVRFKCANRQVYEDAMYRLFELGDVWELSDLLVLKSGGTCGYSHNDDQLTIEFTN